MATNLFPQRPELTPTIYAYQDTNPKKYPNNSVRNYQ